jgi:CBS domain containing-hemolysin-like protein
MTLSNTLFCVFLVSCAFVLSSSEIAIFSLSRMQLKKIKDQSEPLFRRIRTLIHDSMGLLITVLLFNEIVNITLASILTSSIVAPLQLNLRNSTILGVLITTPIILICCELTPKVIASKANQMIISTFLPLVYPLYLSMKPLVSLIRIFLPQQPIRELHQLHEEDFMILAEEQAETGHLHETELELIKNVFEMDDQRVEQIATPIKQILTIPSTATFEQASQIILKERIYSRIPVYEKSKDDIVGVISTKDIVELKIRPELKSQNILGIANEPLVVAGTMTIDALFRKMKAKKVQVAFVKNTAGKITGMISLQDILDLLIEEAFEE